MYFELKTCCGEMYNQLNLDNIKVKMHAVRDNNVKIKFQIRMIDVRSSIIHDTWKDLKACPFCGHTKGLKRIR